MYKLRDTNLFMWLEIFNLKKLYTIYFWCWEVDIGANAFLSVFCLSPRTFDHNPIQSCLSTTNVSRPRPVTLYLYDFICFIHYMENLTNVCYALITTQYALLLFYEINGVHYYGYGHKQYIGPHEIQSVQLYFIYNNFIFRLHLLTRIHRHLFIT